MASFKKLNNGSYQATISCGRDANNKQIRKYVTRPTLKECKTAAREIETEYEEGLLLNIKNIRLSAWMDEWLKVNKNSLSPSTYGTYKIYINTHFKPALGQLKLFQVHEMHIKEYVNDKLERLSQTTVRKHLLVLNKILNDALKHKNPAKDIKPPAQTRYKPHIVTDSEFQSIHYAARGSKWEAAILLSGWCGMRRGEIFALKWDDINWDNKTIRVDEARSISEDGYVSKAPKSENGFRTIAAPEYLIKLLEKMKKQGMNERIYMGRPDNFTHRFHDIAKKLNMPDIRFHDLRHYHASWLYNQNIPDQHAADRLGHDIQTLKRIYQHIDAGKRKDLDKTIINLIENPGE